MQYYDLRQSGPEVQMILDGFNKIQEDFNTLNQDIGNLPLKVITQAKSPNYKINNIDSTGLYYIETAALSREEVETYFINVPIDVDHIFIMHLQGSKQDVNNSQVVTYKSQFLYTQKITQVSGQDPNVEPMYFKRSTNKHGYWGNFTNPFEQIELNLKNMLKINSWD